MPRRDKEVGRAHAKSVISDLNRLGHKFSGYLVYQAHDGRGVWRRSLEYQVKFLMVHSLLWVSSVGARSPGKREKTVSEMRREAHQIKVIVPFPK